MACPSQLVGQTLGHYRIVEQIGAGGMGVVYRAYDEELERDVAIKVLPVGTLADEAARKRFRKEALALARLNHPNIATIFEFSSENSTNYLVTEYIGGQTIDEKLTRGALPEKDVVGLGIELAQGLCAAHAQDVVHRDLKPANLRLTSDGRLKILDFGLAQLMPHASEIGMTATLTQSQEVTGTLPYMAPEQLRGEPAEARTDIWAAGAVLYEMATAHRPFEEKVPTALAGDIIHKDPPPPRRWRSELSPKVEAVILKCLEKEPSKRYQSARELQTDLERLGTGLAPLVARTRLWPVLVATLMALLLVVTASYYRVTKRKRIGSASMNARMGVPALAQGKFVAVLPFRALGNQSSMGYVAEGLAEDISTKLFQLPSLRMASSSATATVDLKESLPNIGGKLGTNLIIVGTVQSAGDKIRIIVNLEDVADDKRVWSHEFSGLSADLLNLEDQISSGIIDALQLNPVSAELVRVRAHPTENVGAFDLYLRGRNALRNQQQPKSVEEAISYFDQALKMDPHFALAYTGLADASLVMYAERKDSFWSQKALVAAQQAQALDDKLAEAHFALGSVYTTTGKTSEAIVQLKRALQLSPNSDEAYRRLGAAYLAEGQKEQAIEAYQKAVLINPYYWFNENSIGNAHFQLGQYDKALRAYQRVIELEPNNAWGYMNIGVIHMQQGKYDQSIPEFQKALELQPSEDVYSNLGTASFFLRRYGESVRMFEKSVEMNPNDEGLAGNLADAYRWSGQKEKAKTTYERAIALGFKQLEVNPRDATTLGDLALYYARKGDPTRGIEFIRRARSINGADVNLLYDEAVVENLADRPSQAVKSLRSAFAKGFPPAQAEADPDLDNLRNRPEFERLLKQFNSKSG